MGKKTFGANTFASKTFASATWRGVSDSTHVSPSHYLLLRGGSTQAVKMLGRRLLEKLLGK